MKTYLELAKAVLSHNEKYLSSREINDYAKRDYPNEYNHIVSGVTPYKTFSSGIYVDMVNNPNTEFIKVENPTRFGLRSKKYPNQSISSTKNNKVDLKKNKQDELNLHKFLTTFVKKDPRFMLYCKTINANKSQNSIKGKNEWVHPDILGVRFNSLRYRNCYELIKINNGSLFDLFSFEIKVSINTLSELNEYYFQAVSNSSWANYGYLVARDISEDEDFKEKCRILNDQFGIGIIRLELSDITQSEVICEAKYHNFVNYEFLNMFMNLDNSDIKNFFSAVNNDSRSDIEYVNEKNYDDYFDNGKEAMNEALKLKLLINC